MTRFDRWSKRIIVRLGELATSYSLQATCQDTDRPSTIRVNQYVICARHRARSSVVWRRVELAIQKSQKLSLSYFRSLVLIGASEWPKHVRAYGGWLGSEEPMKDVAACEKLRGGGKQPLIRRYPNGETHPDEVGILHIWIHRMVEGTWGSETSQYPEEKKKI